MKKNLTLIWAVVLLLTACQQKPVTAEVDTDAIKAEVTAFLDDYNAAYRGLEYDKVLASMTDDALTLGTDPSEFWSKKDITELFTGMKGDTTVNFNWKLERREVIVKADGKYVLVVEQYYVPYISMKIMARSISGVVREGDKLKIDFTSWSLIPKNEDIPMLNAAL